MVDDLIELSVGVEVKLIEESSNGYALIEYEKENITGYAPVAYLEKVD